MIRGAELPDSPTDPRNHDREAGVSLARNAPRLASRPVPDRAPSRPRASLQGLEDAASGRSKVWMAGFGAHQARAAYACAFGPGNSGLRPPGGL